MTKTSRYLFTLASLLACLLLALFPPGKVAPVQAQATTSWKTFNTSNSPLPGNYVNAIAIDQDGSKWFGTYGSGVAHFDGAAWTIYNTSNSALPSNLIHAITIDNDGSKWISTAYGGVARFDGANWTVYNYTNSPLPVTSDINGSIFGGAIDHDGSKWFGTVNGVARFDGANWTIYDQTNTNGGLPWGAADIAIDTDGSKWFATHFGAVHFDGVNWTLYTTTNSGLTANAQYSVAVDNNGVKWFGGTEVGGGVTSFDGTTWTNYNTSNSPLPSNWIQKIAVGPNGEKWFAAVYGGAAMFDGPNWTVYNPSNSSIASNAVVSVAVAGNGEKWFGTTSGVSLLNAETSPGDVYGWGYAGLGQLGSGTFNENIRVNPGPVGSLNDIVAISGGVYHTLALKSDGTVWATGQNGFGQLGDSSTLNKASPGQVPGINHVVAIAGDGYHSLALKNDGTVWGWGNTAFGQLGPITGNPCPGFGGGGAYCLPTPIQIAGLSGVTAIAGGTTFTTVLKKDGTVWSLNGSGNPYQISGLNGIIALSTGAYTTYALKNDGTVWTVGSPPSQVAGLSDVVAIAGGLFHGLALKTDGTVWAWGRNDYGALGNGTTTDSNIPVQVVGLSDVTAVAGGSWHSLALKKDGTVWSWGANYNAQLGDGSFTNSPVPVPVSLPGSAVAISAGAHHSLAILAPRTSDISLSTGNLNFGDQKVGTTSSPQAVTITNNSQVNFRINKATLTGINPNNFELASPSLPVLVAPGKSSTFNLTFAPDKIGNRSANLEIWGNTANNPLKVTLTGNGIEPNRPPTATPGGPYSLPEGTTLPLNGSGADPDNNPITCAWDLDHNGTYETPCQGAVFSAVGRDGTFGQPAGLQVCDNQNLCATATTTITITNAPPSATFQAITPVNEGSSFSLSLTSPSDPSPADLAAGFQYAFDCGDSAGFSPYGLASSVTCPAADNGTPSVKGKLKDKDGGETLYIANVTVNNVAPIVGPITAPYDPKQINTAINTGSSFTDPGILDTHTAQWNWGDGTTSPGSLNETGGSGSVTGSHIYSAPGVYTLNLTVTDKDGGQGQATFQYVVIYDPNAGFVTGGGWINSPAGAYVPDPSLTGKANFGIDAKYKKGASIPDGNTEFQFHGSDFNFKSTSYDWLVINGPKAQYKGTGTINGKGSYGFIITVIDGKVNGGGNVDRFRIRIWDKATGNTVYDNQLNAGDNANPTSALGGGSITLHKS